MTAMTTTVKVTAETREQLRRLGAERQLTADQVIQQALTALERDAQRAATYARAVELANDPANRAEMLAVAQDMEHLRAR